ncbi:unnamed protein product, partial [Adineta steineri]
MYCRSLCMVSRLAINTSYIGTRCLVASYNKQILYPSQQSNRYLAQQTLNQRRPGRIRRFFRWFGWGAEPIVSTLPPPPPPATTMQRIKR